MDNKNNFIPDDDFEYEKELAEKAREEKSKQKAEQEAYLAKQKQLEKIREKRLQAEKIELMKLKNGVIEESENFKEEHDPVIELHGVAKLKNIWFHFKWIILFVIFLLLVVAYILYNTFSRTEADLNVLMTCNNGLQYRQEELESFFEKYTDDFNGDGKVEVTVIMTPLDVNVTDQTMMANQTKFFGTMQSGDALLIITDSSINDTIKNVLNTELSKDFPDNKYINEQGLSLNMELFSKEIKYENMPNDVYLSLHNSVKTLNCSEEEMKERYNKAYKVFKRITDDLTKKAIETNDKGLSTEPLKNTNSTSSVESSTVSSNTDK